MFICVAPKLTRVDEHFSMLMSTLDMRGDRTIRVRFCSQPTIIRRSQFSLHCVYQHETWDEGGVSQGWIKAIIPRPAPPSRALLSPVSTFLARVKCSSVRPETVLMPGAPPLALASPGVSAHWENLRHQEQTHIL